MKLILVNIVDNTFYFPGWHVVVDKQEVPIEFQNEAYRGLITFKIPPGIHQVEIKFTDTKLRLVADIISFATVILCLLLIILNPLINPKQK